MFSDEYIAATMNSMFRSPRGRAVARRVALGQLPLQDWFLEPPLLALYEAIRKDAALADSFPPELDDQLWNGLKAQVEAYNMGRIRNQEIIPLLTMWTGRFGSAGRGLVESRIGADLLPITAYVLGRRFSVLARQPRAAGPAGILDQFRDVMGSEPRQDAAFFFQRAPQAAPRGSPVSRAAEQALAEIRRAPGTSPGS